MAVFVALTVREKPLKNSQLSVSEQQKALYTVVLQTGYTSIPFCAPEWIEQSALRQIHFTIFVLTGAIVVLDTALDFDQHTRLPRI
jgi:hypothetical protein